MNILPSYDSLDLSAGALAKLMDLANISPVKAAVDFFKSNFL
jgi:hypothetical protein